MKPLPWLRSAYVAACIVALLVLSATLLPDRSRTDERTIALDYFETKLDEAAQKNVMKAFELGLPYSATLWRDRITYELKEDLLGSKNRSELLNSHVISATFSQPALGHVAAGSYENSKKQPITFITGTDREKKPIKHTEDGGTTFDFVFMDEHKRVWAFGRPTNDPIGQIRSVALPQSMATSARRIDQPSPPRRTMSPPALFLGIGEQWQKLSSIPEMKTVYDAVVLPDQTITLFGTNSQSEPVRLLVPTNSNGSPNIWTNARSELLTNSKSEVHTRDGTLSWNASDDRLVIVARTRGKPNPTRHSFAVGSEVRVRYFAERDLTVFATAESGNPLLVTFRGTELIGTPESIGVPQHFSALGAWMESKGPDSKIFAGFVERSRSYKMSVYGTSDGSRWHRVESGNFLSSPMKVLGRRIAGPANEEIADLQIPFRPLKDLVSDGLIQVRVDTNRNVVFIIIGTVIVAMLIGYTLLPIPRSDATADGPIPGRDVQGPLDFLAASARREMKSMLTRASWLLFSGLGMSVLGLVLFYTSLEELIRLNRDPSLGDSAIYARSLGMLLFIEGLAVFFLRQYRAMMTEYKHFYGIYLTREGIVGARELLRDKEAQLGTSDQQTLVQALLAARAIASEPKSEAPDMTPTIEKYASAILKILRGTETKPSEVKSSDVVTAIRGGV
jgi:hypothetical protein